MEIFRHKTRLAGSDVTCHVSPRLILSVQAYRKFEVLDGIDYRNKPSYKSESTFLFSYSYKGYFSSFFHFVNSLTWARSLPCLGRSNAVMPPIIEGFVDFGMLPQDENEINTFSNANIELLRSSGKFTSCTNFRVLESLLRSNYFSST